MSTGFFKETPCRSLNPGRVNQRRNLLLNHLLGLHSTDEGDPDGVFINNVYPLYEAACHAVIVFGKSELGLFEFVEQLPNRVGRDRMIG